MTKNILLFAIFSLGTLGVFAQEQADTIYPANNLCLKKSFTYRLIRSEYIDNGNNYFVASTVDTSYLKFVNTGVPYVFRVSTYMDEFCKQPLKGMDTFRRVKPEIEFTKRGKIKELKNWKVYRDLIISLYSAQVRSGEITTSQFKEMRDSVNKEVIVRRMVIDDLNYMFSLSEDTFRTDIEYLRVKAMRSPMSDEDYYILGNLKVSRMPGTKNSVLFEARNSAGPAEKPYLLEEAKKYMRAKTPEGELVQEVTKVGLNSEQEFQYNLAQGRMMRIQLSDVLVLNESSRGNVRVYNLWDIGE